jgi:glycerophosphoryl diester phosphodiesterase
MTWQAALRGTLMSYREALGCFWPCLAVFISNRLLTTAILSPAAGVLLSLGLGSSGRLALTDQEIASFLFTPTGLAIGLFAACLALISAILDVAALTGFFRSRSSSAGDAIHDLLHLLFRRPADLLAFAANLLFRLLALAAPFLLIAAAIVVYSLRDHDINYYLTYWPPEFVLAIAVLAILTLGLAALLAHRLSGWALLIPLLIFTTTSPAQTFSASAQALSGHRREIIYSLITWLAARVFLGIVATALAGTLINVAPTILGTNLKTLALAVTGIFVLWLVASIFIAAISNGALAHILNGYYEHMFQPKPAKPRKRQPRSATGRPMVKVALGLALLTGIGSGLYLATTTLDRVTAVRTVEIIAHRGSAAVRPENTMAAVTKAIEDQADWIEIDVQETGDGEVVVAHDSDFMKVAGRDLKIWDATMQDLAGFDVGSWFDPDYADERTPTLRDVLLAAKGRSKVLIELKYYGHDKQLEKRVASIVDDAGMAADIAIMSLKYAAVEKMQALRPTWRYGVLAARAIGNISALPADFLALNTGQITSRLIRRAHVEGKQVYAWTVDDPLIMSRLISMGVDGLITNEPEIARQAMQTRNKLSTYERLLLWLASRFNLGSYQLTASGADA